MLVLCPLFILPMSRIYSISPALAFNRIGTRHRPTTCRSRTYRYLQQVLGNKQYHNHDVVNYLKKIPAFYGYSNAAMAEYSSLVFECMHLEEEYSSSHHLFFHGTLATKFILLRTILEQTATKTTHDDFFLLRNKGALDHLRESHSGYRYAIDKMKKTYTANGSLGRFDSQEPVRTDLISVTTNLLAHALEGSNEDSISYVTSERFSPRGLDSWITTCLRDYAITDIPLDQQRFLHKPLGSTIALCIPKKLSALAYKSIPFGIPVGLPHIQMLTGKLSQESFKQALEIHQESNDVEIGSTNTESHQARIVLHPDYFEKNSGEIAMKLFVWERPDEMEELNKTMRAIAAPLKKSAR